MLCSQRSRCTGQFQIIFPEFIEQSGPIIISLRQPLFSKEIPKLFGFASEDKWSIPMIDELLQRFDRKDIAAALQRVLEEEVLKAVSDALQMTDAPDVVLAGGVFSNVKLNQRIRE